MSGSDQIEVLTKSIGDFRSKLEERLGKIEAHVGEASLSYYEPTNEPVMKGLRVSDDWQRMRGRRRYPEGYKPHTVWKSFGSFLREGVLSHFTDKGGNAMKASEFGGRYHGIFKSVQGLGSSIGSEAGFAILPEFAPGIHDRIWENDILSRVDQYTVAGNRMTFPRLKETSRATGSRAGGLQAYWVDEGAPATGSKPKLAETELKLKKLVVVVYLTNELIEDNSMALEQWVNRKVQEELQFMVGNSIINGSGGGMPLGISKSPALISVAKEDSQAADTIKAENIINMWARRLANTPKEGWVWIMHQTCEAELQRMYVATGSAVGGLVFMPPTGISAGPYSTLQGLPILVSEFAPTLGDANDVMLANMKEYVAITKGGVQQSQSTDVEFLTDQLAIKFTMRLDGRPYEDAAVTPFAAGATTPPTQSAFIGLAERA